MGGFSIKTKIDCIRTKRFLEKMQNEPYFKVLEECGKMGVDALSENTPRDTGATAGAWSYSIEKSFGKTTLVWSNSHKIINGTPLVIMLQYGHGTGTGGYVAGRDFINPAIRPVFDEIADIVWKVVSSE